MLYSKRPDIYHQQLDYIIDALSSEDANFAYAFVQIFAAIAKEHPQLIRLKHIDHIFTVIQHGSET
jgi:hypothetical protein